MPVFILSSSATRCQWYQWLERGSNKRRESRLHIGYTRSGKWPLAQKKRVSTDQKIGQDSPPRTSRGPVLTPEFCRKSAWLLGERFVKDEDQSLFLANALPDGLFRYISKSSAFWRSAKATAVLIRQGLCLAVCGLLPWLWDLRRDSRSSVKPV